MIKRDSSRLAQLLLASVILISSLNFISAASRFSFQSVLGSWADYGVFDLLLPFLLVFALIYGLISKMGLLGDNKGVHAIIAAAIGLMALVEGHFVEFLKVFSTNVSMAVSILLAAIILMGLFIQEDDKKKKNWVYYVIFGVGAIAFVVLTADTFSRANLGYGSNLWDDYGPALVTLLILGGLIAAVIAGGKSGSGSSSKL